MGTHAIEVEGVWKRFRWYHEKNQYLKSTVLRGTRARYDDFWALSGVDFDVKEGATFGIIGRNGSGKSTLLKCLTGILDPDKGTVRTHGRVAALLELGAGFHPELSGRENIFLNGAILGMTRREILGKFDDIVAFSGISDFLDMPVKNYSSGMSVRLGFSVAINVDPDILIIDEVLAVGDEMFQQQCYEKIESFRKEGRTIVFVSHGLAQVTQLCETACWLDRGEVRMLGNAYGVVSEYTGDAHGARPTEDGDIGERWGSGEALIERVEILDERGQSSRVLRSGQLSTIRIHVSTHAPLDDLVCGVRVTHLHGFNVWGTNTKRRNFRIPTLNGQHVIELEIPRLPILEGTYELTIALSDMAEVHEYDHWEKRTRFEVRQDGTYDEGVVNVTAQWSIN